LLLQQLLEKKDAPVFALLNRQSIETLLRDDFTWPWYGQLMKLPQTIAFILQINYWLETYKINIS